MHLDGQEILLYKSTLVGHFFVYTFGQTLGLELLKQCVINLDTLPLSPSF
jgi:hypothetical protein